MTQFTWTLDAPSGVYKSHELSETIFRASVAESKFMDHVTPASEFGKKMGDTITFKRVTALTEPTSAALIEGVRIPEDALTLSTTSITVAEIGRSVPFTSLAEDLSTLDLEGTIQGELRRQMTLVLDQMAATEFQTTQIKYTPTGLASGTFNTAGSPTTATANMNVFHAEEIADYMYDTLFVEPVGDDFIAIFRTMGIRGIKRDPDWEEWHKYTAPAAKYNGEVGRIEGIRFIQTNHSTALASGMGTGSVLGEGVVFGRNACYIAEAQSPELRAQINKGQDFGRQHAVAWYGILAFGLPWDTGNAGQAKIVHVTSS